MIRQFQASPNPKICCLNITLKFLRFENVSPSYIFNQDINAEVHHCDKLGRREAERRREMRAVQKEENEMLLFNVSLKKNDNKV